MKFEDKFRQRCKVIIENIKKSPYTWGLSTVILLVAIPLVLWFCYFIGDCGFILIKTSLTIDGFLDFYGSFLAFLGTVALGALALWQNHKFKIENDKAQSKLEQVNDNVLNLDIKKDKERLFEIYFKYLDQTQNIFNPEYVLGHPKECKDALSIFLTLKSCHIEILGTKRRLMFLDSQNSDNSFFQYIEDKSSEISKIAMLDKKEEITKELFQFWINNSEEYNKKSLTFMIQIRKSIFNKTIK